MFSQEVADRVCEQIASGKSLRQIAQLDGMPYPPTVMDWVKNRFGDSPGFCEQYAHAVDARTELMAEELIEIADGTPESDVNRDRLRVDTRKWVASKLLPKKYGDATKIEHSGEVTNLTLEQARQIAQDRANAQT